MIGPKHTGLRPTLFIGGSSDGEWIALDERQDTYRLRARRELTPTVDRSTTQDGVVSVELYNAHFFAGNDRRFRVMVFGNMTGDELFERLLFGYKPGGK